MATALWMEQATNRAPIKEVMLEAGLTRVGKRGYSPCPACGADVRSDKEHAKRGAVEPVDEKGWWCIACNNKGDVLNLVSYSLYHQKLGDLTQEDRWKVREWFAVRQWCDPYEQKEVSPFSGKPAAKPDAPKEPAKVEAPRKYPPQHEVQALWDACLPLHQSDGHHYGGLDVVVSAFLKHRNWSPNDLSELDLLRLTPHPDDYEWPDWWPKGRAGLWRIIVRAYDYKGELRSLHARAVRQPDEGFPKVLWPKDKMASGLIMADHQGLMLLQGIDRPDIIIICEGITDLAAVSLRKSSFPNRKVAVLSCTSGGFQALTKVRWPWGVPTFAATDIGDKDGKGDLYATEIARSLIPSRVSRIRF